MITRPRPPSGSTMMERTFAGGDALLRAPEEELALPETL
jgi:hypothetical protein